MPTVFSRIIDGELPARFVWRDDTVVAFLSAGPIVSGHTLVVPRAEVDQWTDASPELWAEVTRVAHLVGAAQKQAWDAPRAGLVVAGFEVPHLHVHVMPAWDMAALDFARADTDPDPAALDADAERLRAALRDRGHGAYVP